MNQQESPNSSLTEQGVIADLQSQPHLMIKLQENALLVAESLRDNYFTNTAKFVTHLRRAMREADLGKRDQILSAKAINELDWQKVQGEVVTFIDGGLGQVQMSSPVPILLRVGSYRVRTGERNLAEREQFGYYPVILGDLEGGSKERKDFPDIVRITAELLGGLSALKRTPDLRVLMFHGPLVYMMSGYAGHTPFTEKDIDLFLNQYAQEPELAQQLKDEFIGEAELEIYPKMAPDRCDEWVERRLFEPLSWIAFLYRQLIKEAKQRKPKTIITGVIERGGELREFSETVLLERIFINLRKKKKQNYFNELYGRKDIKSPKALLDRLGYTDALLLSMLLEPGQFSEPWEIKNKYAGLTKGKISLPDESYTTDADWGCLKLSNKIGFPKVRGCYVKVSETTEPFRIEVFADLGTDQILEAARRAYLYARVLPGYAFPVGLDIVDKYAKIPNWLTESYSKLIKYHLGVSLQNGQITDAEMRRIIVQSIYMTKRDWLFRPNV
ncbi:MULTISPECIES: DNA double-strand break repair nuclease NurA [unclassified Coleofasciculus]|uniref:DNA double-strand break repair nuclease NurA n=1 Tax=unclassified Coleofasciculus TaxID=2692782 RepID=UPI001882C816|nr:MULTISPECIES: DNA double-strand break repair nuclease NurA [unclassified Coleofasciculus]MBE9125376.1 DNA double-strand break repair nuclease NurA [Coleofasciculus sp. LEGE 07081]MBE9147407.1 DNA double-strand break repair nuclease NurA [Coleofasciculus sp. LEGE 07092]